MSFHRKSLFISGWIAKSSALRHGYQLEMIGEEKDLIVSKCGTVTSHCDDQEKHFCKAATVSQLCRRAEFSLPGLFHTLREGAH